jgi:hypothetical protein
MFNQLFDLYFIPWIIVNLFTYKGLLIAIWSDFAITQIMG